jgi:hypothetical protein
LKSVRALFNPGDDPILKGYSFVLQLLMQRFDGWRIRAS